MPAHTFLWAWKNFAHAHAQIGAAVYMAVIVIANLDKSFVEIFWLALRQGIFSYLVAGMFVPYVQLKATTGWLSVIGWGIFFPAATVAVASTLAHAAFSDEERNIIVPFLVSVGLNTGLSLASRRGHHTLTSQVRWFFGHWPLFLLTTIFICIL